MLPDQAGALAPRVCVIGLGFFSATPEAYLVREGLTSSPVVETRNCSGAP